MSTKEKWIFSILIPVFGIICFVGGGYLGSGWGSAISESPVFIANHKRLKSIYECGSVGDTQCFEDNFRDLAAFNSMYAYVLIGREPIGIFHSDLEKIRMWNENIADGSN